MGWCVDDALLPTVSVLCATQATSNVEFALALDTVTVGIVSALQYSVDLTATPWLRVDYVNNR
jgi:hypothetical protein